MEGSMYEVYKVVKVINDKWVSAAVEEPEVQLTYQLHQVTMGLPRSLGVFVFADRESAWKWARAWLDYNYTSEFYVLRCYTSDEPQIPSAIGGYRKVVELLHHFKKCSWARRLKWAEKFMSYKAPSNTRVVRSIVPIEIV
jgi:hypothetical protein